MAKRQPKTESKEYTISFEDALRELEGVVAKLESGNLPLEESLAAYETAIGRLKFCYRKLDSAERRIELVQKVEGDGVAQVEEFGEDELTLDEKREARSERRSRRNDLE